MAVLEVGLIHEGLPIFKIDFHLEVKGDATLRSGLFSAIQSFAKEAFGDETEELRLKNLTICLKTVHLDDGRDIALYAVADKDSHNIDPIKNSLIKAGEQIRKMLTDGQHKLSTIEPDKNDVFKPVFENEFKDLRMRPAERAKRLFG